MRESHDNSHRVIKLSAMPRKKSAIIIITYPVSHLLSCLFWLHGGGGWGVESFLKEGFGSLPQSALFPRGLLLTSQRKWELHILKRVNGSNHCTGRRQEDSRGCWTCSAGRESAARFTHTHTLLEKRAVLCPICSQECVPWTPSTCRPASVTTCCFRCSWSQPVGFVSSHWS